MIDLNALLAGFQAGKDLHAVFSDAVMRGKEFDVCLVGLSIDRASREAGGTRLNAQFDNHNPATPGRRCQRTMRATCTTMTRTSGVRSNWPIGGTNRRSGRRKGRVRASSTGAAGV